MIAISYLTMRRRCDASIMAGDGAFGAVGAAPGIRNPVDAAAALLAHARRGLMPLGRIPPLFLAGDGARRWAAGRGLAAAADSDDADYNVGAAARRRWEDHRRRLDSYCRSAGHGPDGPEHAAAAGGGAAAEAEDESDGGGGGERDHDTVRPGRSVRPPAPGPVPQPVVNHPPSHIRSVQ